MMSISTVPSQTTFELIGKKPKGSKLIISNSDGHHFIDSDTILYLKSDGNYCTVFLIGGRKIVCSRTMKSIFLELNQHQFIRSHNSIVFNWKKVQYINHSISEAKLEGGIVVPISRARKKEVKARIV